MTGILSLIVIVISIKASDLTLHNNDIIDLTGPARRFSRDEIDSMQELPEAEPMIPGHMLLRPSKTMLKSASKFPSDMTNAVYGNMDNLGITHGKTNERVLYTGFRKGNNMLATILEAMKKQNQYKGNQKQAIIIIDSRPLKQHKNLSKSKVIENYLNNIEFSPDEENNANEIFDATEEIEDYLRHRRRGRQKISPYRDRNEHYNASSSSSESSSSGSSDFEKNPGNPFTIHKDKYRQNWLWNHFMDGDHMNINPYGPKLHEMGAPGAQLFFNRKWWYFNQDDYKPMG